MDLIMNPMLLDGDDPNSNSVPLFSRNGRPLSTAERQRMAQRKGICLRCGIKTHEKGSMMGKLPLTNSLVLQGRCRKCHGLSEVDAAVVREDGKDSASLSERGDFRLSDSSINEAIESFKRSPGLTGSQHRREGSSSEVSPLFSRFSFSAGPRDMPVPPVLEETAAPHLERLIGAQDSEEIEWSPPLDGSMGDVSHHSAKNGVVDDLDKDEEEPRLHQAIRDADYDLAKMLLDQGADPDIRDKRYGRTPLALLAFIHDMDEGCLALAQLLMERGADVNTRDSSDQTPLHHLACSKDPTAVAMARLLIDAGADLNATDRKGKTPLRCAVPWSDNDTMTKLLIRSGADVNAQDLDESTALHLAAERKDGAALVRLLLEAGANVHIKDGEGKTPLERALECDVEGSVDLLIKALENNNEFSENSDDSEMSTTNGSLTDEDGMLRETQQELTFSNDQHPHATVDDTTNSHEDDTYLDNSASKFRYPENPISSPVLGRKIKKDDSKEQGCESSGGTSGEAPLTTSASSFQYPEKPSSASVLFEQQIDSRVTEDIHFIARLNSADMAVQRVSSKLLDWDEMLNTLQAISGLEDEIRSLIASAQDESEDHLELRRILNNPVSRDFYLSFTSQLSAKIVACQSLYSDNVQHTTGPLSRQHLWDMVSQSAAKGAFKGMSELSEKLTEGSSLVDAAKAGVERLLDLADGEFSAEVVGGILKDTAKAIQLPGTYAAAAVLAKLISLPTEITRKRQISYAVLFAAMAEKDGGLDKVLHQTSRKFLRVVQRRDLLSNKSSEVTWFKKLRKKLGGSLDDTVAKECGTKAADVIFGYVTNPEEVASLWAILNCEDQEPALSDALVCEAFQISLDDIPDRYSFDAPAAGAGKSTKKKRASHKGKMGSKENETDDSDNKKGVSKSKKSKKKKRRSKNKTHGDTTNNKDEQEISESNHSFSQSDTEFFDKQRIERMEKAVQNLTKVVEASTGKEIDVGRQVLLKRIPEEEYQYRLEKMEELVHGLAQQLATVAVIQETTRETLESDLRSVEDELETIRHDWQCKKGRRPMTTIKS